MLDGAAWHVAGRYHLLNVATNKPLGTYSAVVTGLGSFSMNYDAALPTVTLPNARTRKLPDGTYYTTVDVPVTKNTYDIMLLITAQNATSPITSFKFYAPGCCSAANGACNSTCSATFNPAYLKTVSGFQGVRTMDWQSTNGANLANFEDRNTKNAISQARSILRVMYIQSVDCWRSGTLPPFFQGAPLAMVTTAVPHNLTTGQLVVVKNTGGGYLTASSATPVTFDMDETMVFVLTPTSFAYRSVALALPHRHSLVACLMSIADVFQVAPLKRMSPCLATNNNRPGPNAAPNLPVCVCSLADWRGSPQVSSCNPGGVAGWVKLEIRPGVAYEYIAEVAGLLQTDPWVNVPHLATDAFIASFADWWATNLPSGRKLYVELSNEVGCIRFGVHSHQ